MHARANPLRLPARRNCNVCSEHVPCSNGRNGISSYLRCEGSRHEHQMAAHRQTLGTHRSVKLSTTCCADGPLIRQCTSCHGCRGRCPSLESKHACIPCEKYVSLLNDRCNEMKPKTAAAATLSRRQHGPLSATMKIGHVMGAQPACAQSAGAACIKRVYK